MMIFQILNISKHKLIINEIKNKTMKLEFNATVSHKQTDVFGINDYLEIPESILVRTYDPTTEVKYYMTLNIGEQGIKDIDVEIEQVKASIEWEIEFHGLTQDEVIAIELQHGSIGGKKYWYGVIEINQSDNITNEVEFSDNGHYSIENVQFDLSINQITLL
jgi:hypothetical protein